jgi:hypothetical protein
MKHQVFFVAWLATCLFANAETKIMRVRKESSSFTVELEKMNVMYIGVENPILIGYSGFCKPIVKVTDGYVKEGNTKGRFLVQVTKPNVSTLSLYVKSGRREKLIGEKKIRVKRIPDPTAFVAGLKDGFVKRSALLAAPFVVCKLENFDFDLVLKVRSFVLSVNVAGEYKSYLSTGNAFSMDQLLAISKLKNNSKIYFEDIKVVAPDGSIRKLNTIILRMMS